MTAKKATPHVPLLQELVCEFLVSSSFTRNFYLSAKRQKLEQLLDGNRYADRLYLTAEPYFF